MTGASFDSDKCVAAGCPFPAAQGHDIGFVSALTLADILAPVARVDLIDMDIQSAEFRVVPPAMDVLDRKVRRMQIGTHGKEVHEHLVRTFDTYGWEIVFDFEPNSRFESDLGAFETDDGILAVVNPRLLSIFLLWKTEKEKWAGPSARPDIAHQCGRALGG